MILAQNKYIFSIFVIYIPHKSRNINFFLHPIPHEFPVPTPSSRLHKGAAREFGKNGKKIRNKGS